MVLRTDAHMNSEQQEPYGLVGWVEMALRCLISSFQAGMALQTRFSSAPLPLPHLKLSQRQVHQLELAPWIVMSHQLEQSPWRLMSHQLGMSPKPLLSHQLGISPWSLMSHQLVMSPWEVMNHQLELSP